jgi:hypothetical protein
LIGGLEAWAVNSGSTDVGLRTMFRLETGRVDSSTGDTRSFAVGGGLEAWSWVYGSLVDTDFLTVAWLEFGSILTFGKVNLGLVRVTTVVWKVNGDISVLCVVAATLLKLCRLVMVVTTVGNFDVDVSVLVFSYRSVDARSKSQRREENKSVKVTVSTDERKRLKAPVSGPGYPPMARASKQYCNLNCPGETLL